MNKMTQFFDSIIIGTLRPGRRYMYRQSVGMYHLLMYHLILSGEFVRSNPNVAIFRWESDIQSHDFHSFVVTTWR